MKLATQTAFEAVSYDTTGGVVTPNLGAWVGRTINYTIDRPISYKKWLYGNSNPILYVDPIAGISVNEDKLAKRVATYLEDNYHIRITIDWGYMTIPIPHPEPGGSAL